MRLSELRQLVFEVAGDAYKVLGVPTSASDDDIKKAYRRKSIEFHPDKNQGKDTTKDMVKVNVAYGILSDPKKRARYDMTGDKTIDTMDGSKYTGQGALGGSGSTYGYGYSPRPPQPSSAADDFASRVRREYERQQAQRRAAKQDAQDREDAQQRSERREAERREAERRAQASSADPQRASYVNPVKRYFTYHDTATNSHKFWWIRLNKTSDGMNDGTVTTGWGRIGTPGQIKTKTAPRGMVNKYSWSLINSKLRKGYMEGKPGAPEPPSPQSSSAEQGTKAETPKPQPKQTGPKTTYKVYGRKGPASVHTRYKGTAYGPAQSSKFKPGMQAKVNVGTDKRASVTDPSNDHTQLWDPIPEAFCSLVGDMILEARAKKSQLSDFESMIRSNADMALDQRNDYENLTDCLDSYYANVQDSAMEIGIRPSEHNTFELYRRYVREIAAKLGIELPEDYK